MKIGPYPLSDARWSIEDLGSGGPAAGRRRGGRAELDIRAITSENFFSLYSDRTGPVRTA